LLAGKFTLQRCGDCGQAQYPPRVFCKHCGSPKISRFEASGNGTVYATSVVRNRPDKGGDHNVCLVDLAEGPRMMSRVEGVAPTAVTIGMKVTARAIVDGDVPYVVFDVAKG